MASFYVISLWNYMNREIYANTNSEPRERVPSLKSLLFRHLLFKLGRAGHGPWAAQELKPAYVEISAASYVVFLV